MSTDIIPNVSRSIRYTNDTRRHTHTQLYKAYVLSISKVMEILLPHFVCRKHTHTQIYHAIIFVVTSTSPRRQTDLIDWEPVNELSVKQQANAEQAWTVSPAEGRWRQLGFLWRWCWRRIKVSRFSWTSSAADVSLVFLSLFTWSLSRFS